jgi:hypothetical protein
MKHPGPLGPGVFGVVRLLVRVAVVMTVAVAVVFFLGGLIDDRRLCRVELQPCVRALIAIRFSRVTDATTSPERELQTPRAVRAATDGRMNE